MKQECPYCLELHEFTSGTRDEAFEVRGESIEVMDHFLKCSGCGGEISDPNYDTLKVAYDKYREKHNFVTAEQIKDFRKSIGLTQVELGQLLGWGKITLSRYEQGSLQDDAHDSALQMAMTPDGFNVLITKKPNILSKEKVATATNNLISKCLSKSLAAEIGKELRAELRTAFTELKSDHEDKFEELRWEKQKIQSLFENFGSTPQPASKVSRGQFIRRQTTETDFEKFPFMRSIREQ